MRGQTAVEGETRVSKNGYHYTKVKGSWELTHHLVAEKMLGRPLEPDERVSFVTGNKLDLRPDNIRVSKKGKSSLRQKKARLEARIEELTAELELVIKELQ